MTLQVDNDELPVVKIERQKSEARIVTDNLAEMCEFECLLCGQVLVESTLSKHLKVSLQI